MRISLLPQRNWPALLRLSFLVLLLAVVIIGCLELRDVGRSGEVALRAAWYLTLGRWLGRW